MLIQIEKYEKTKHTIEKLTNKIVEDALWLGFLQEQEIKTPHCQLKRNNNNFALKVLRKNRVYRVMAG